MSGDILFLAHRTPYPPDRGDKIRSWNVLNALAKLAPVHVAALCTDPDEQRYAETLRQVSASVTLVPHQGRKLAAMASALVSGGSASVSACASPALAAHVEAMMASGRIGAIYAFSGQMAQYVPTVRSNTRFLMDFVDMDSAKFAAWGEGRGLGALANRFEARRLYAHERAVANRADLSLFVSDAEAALFRQATGLGADRVCALENGIDLERFHPGHDAPALDGQGPHIVFTGQMDYAPNVEAAIHYARNILPRVRAVLGDARFWIVGRSPVASVFELGALPGVIVTGTVPDPRDHIAGADLIVAPLLLARGIQNKVLEAMAMGKPVLASPAAAEGIDAVADRDFVMADGAEAQAAATLALLADPARRTALGQAARFRMEARYGWDATLAPLGAMLAAGNMQRAAA